MTDIASLRRELINLQNDLVDGIVFDMAPDIRGKEIRETAMRLGLAVARAGGEDLRVPELPGEMALVPKGHVGRTSGWYEVELNKVKAERDMLRAVCDRWKAAGMAPTDGSVEAVDSANAKLAKVAEDRDQWKKAHIERGAMLLDIEAFAGRRDWTPEDCQELINVAVTTRDGALRQVAQLAFELAATRYQQDVARERIGQVLQIPPAEYTGWEHMVDRLIALCVEQASQIGELEEQLAEAVIGGPISNEDFARRMKEQVLQGQSAEADSNPEEEDTITLLAVNPPVVIPPPTQQEIAAPREQIASDASNPVADPVVVDEVVAASPPELEPPPQEPSEPASQPEKSDPPPFVDAEEVKAKEERELLMAQVAVLRKTYGDPAMRACQVIRITGRINPEKLKAIYDKYVERHGKENVEQLLRAAQAGSQS